MSFDHDRFRVEERHYFGPFYAVRVYDTARGRRVRLKNGVLLVGKSSVRRAVRYGIERYLREEGA